MLQQLVAKGLRAFRGLDFVGLDENTSALKDESSAGSSMGSPRTSMRTEACCRRADNSSRRRALEVHHPQSRETTDHADIDVQGSLPRLDRRLCGPNYKRTFCLLVSGVSTAASDALVFRFELIAVRPRPRRAYCPGPAVGEYEK